MKIKCVDIIADPNDNKSRGELDRLNPQGCLDIARSIEQVGLIQPVSVKKAGDKFRLVAGFRRFIAISVVLGLPDIEAIIVPDDANAEWINAHENLHRKDATFWEQCCMLREMFPADSQMKDIENSLSMSKSWVNIRWKAWYLPDTIRAQIEAGLLGFSDVAMLVQKGVDAERTAEKLIAGKAAGRTIKGMRKEIIGRSQVRAKKQIQRVMTRLLKRENMPMVQALRYAIGEIEEVTLFNWIDRQANGCKIEVDETTPDQPS